MIMSPALIDGSSANMRQLGPEGITVSRAQPPDILSPPVGVVPLVTWPGWGTGEEQRGHDISLGPFSGQPEPSGDGSATSSPGSLGMLKEILFSNIHCSTFRVSAPYATLPSHVNPGLPQWCPQYLYRYIYMYIYRCIV